MRTIPNFLKTRVPVVGYLRAEASRGITMRTIPNFLKTRVPVEAYMTLQPKRNAPLPKTKPPHQKRSFLFVRVWNRKIVKRDPCIILARLRPNGSAGSATRPCEKETSRTNAFIVLRTTPIAWRPPPTKPRREAAGNFSGTTKPAAKRRKIFE